LSAFFCEGKKERMKSRRKNSKPIAKARTRNRNGGIKKRRNEGTKKGRKEGRKEDGQEETTTADTCDLTFVGYPP
jgi:hypothetical protein